MIFLTRCILNILGIGILAAKFNMSCNNVCDFLVVIVAGVLMNASGALSNI